MLTRGPTEPMITLRRAVVLALSLALAVAIVGCGKPAPASILLFAGRGTSPNDVVAFERILTDGHFDYSTASSRQLNGLSEPELRAYRLLIVPGGNFVEVGNGLDADSAARIRGAVGSGLNYLGICAGAFIAGHSPYNGFDLTSGVQFSFYSAEARGIRKAPVLIATPDAPPLEHYWEDGPQLSGWGEVVGKDPDGSPALVQGAAAAGWVVLSGVHPEAPENWRAGMTFTTPASVDNAFAATPGSYRMKGWRTSSCGSTRDFLASG